MSCLDVQNIFIQEDISKYLINFGLLMSFAIFAFNEVLLDHDIEKWKGHVFNKILCNKHSAPPILNLVNTISGARNCRRRCLEDLSFSSKRCNCVFRIYCCIFLFLFNKTIKLYNWINELTTILRKIKPV